MSFVNVLVILEVPPPFFFIRSHDVVCEGQNKKEDFKSLVDLFFWGRMVVTEVDRVGDPLTKKKN